MNLYRVKILVDVLLYIFQIYMFVSYRLDNYGCCLHAFWFFYEYKWAHWAHPGPTGPIRPIGPIGPGAHWASRPMIGHIIKSDKMIYIYIYIRSPLPWGWWRRICFFHWKVQNPKLEISYLYSVGCRQRRHEGTRTLSWMACLFICSHNQVQILCCCVLLYLTVVIYAGHNSSPCWRAFYAL